MASREGERSRAKVLAIPRVTSIVSLAKNGVTNEKGELVNRTEGIASVGSAAMDLEECFTYQKFLRSLGLVYIEHQARI